MTAPQSGSLYQLSQVFSTYEYEPKQGVLITQDGAAVTGSNNRIVYSRPAYDVATNNQVAIPNCGVEQIGDCCTFRLLLNYCSTVFQGN